MAVYIGPFRQPTCLNVKYYLSGLFTAWWLRESPSVLHHVSIVHVLNVYCADPRINYYYYYLASTLKFGSVRISLLQES